MARSTNAKLEEAKSLMLLGEAYQNKGQYTNALEHYLQAQSIFENSKNKLLLANANLKLGSLYKTWNIYDKALKYYQAAYKGYDSGNTKAVIAQNIAEIYTQKNNYKMGIEWHQKTLNAYRLLKNQPKIILCLQTLSTLHLKNAQFEEALNHNLELVELKGKSSNQVGLIEPYNNIGFVYKHQKQYAKALEYYNKALTINKQNIRTNPSLAENQIGLLTNTAVVQIHLNNPQAAEAAYNEALNLSNCLSHKMMTWLLLIFTIIWQPIIIFITKHFRPQNMPKTL